MNKDFPGRVLKIVLLLVSLALTGCGTPAARNFSGSWTPVNQFREQPTVIPLSPTYTFYAAPMDETLKTMLSRWAKDSGRTLSYRLAFDFTLYKPVAVIRTPDIKVAVDQLSAIYAAQGVFVTANDRQILIEKANTASVNSVMAKDVAGISKPAIPTSSK